MSQNYHDVNICIDEQLNNANLIIGAVVAYNVKVKPSSSEFVNQISQLINKVKTDPPMSQNIKDAIRDLLRSGGFKPAGRSKPASEYLAQSAIEDKFPFINNLVDINNYVSLLYGVPISLLDLDVLSKNILIRYGKEGESYVFNSASQSIDLKGLISVCKLSSQGSIPLGSPVKDSMEGKIKDSTQNIIYVVYASSKIFTADFISKILDEITVLINKEADTNSFHKIIL